MTTSHRLATGVPGFDELLGGGLLPGTLTVVVGATGIGKTQLGLQFARAGLIQEQRSGVIFDVSARGDSQSHAAYAERMSGWKLHRVAGQDRTDLNDFYAPDEHLGTTCTSSTTAAGASHDRMSNGTSGGSGKRS